MSAEILRRAASLMRERATHPEVSGSPWEASPHGDVHDDGSLWVCDSQSGDTAEHIASWHPAVALAVAKAMDDCAQAWEICDDGWTRDMDDDAIRFEDTVDGGWLNVARTYLGES